MRATKMRNKGKDRTITSRAREPDEVCGGEMKSSLSVVKVGILHLRLSRGWTRMGVGSPGAVVSCLGGDGGRTPPNGFPRKSKDEGVKPFAMFT